MADWCLRDATIDAFNAADTPTIEQALMAGTRYVVENFDFEGIRVSQDQPLPFPRSGLYDDGDIGSLVRPYGFLSYEGTALASDVVPQRIKDATCLAAYYRLSGELVSSAPSVASRTLGKTSETYRLGSSRRQLGRIHLILRSLLVRDRTNTAVGSVRAS